ncbi:MAG: hypothetical protein U0V54_00915 [Saprospiraceae bacterium]
MLILLLVLVGRGTPLSGQVKNHLTTNIFSTLSSKRNLGLTYHRELGKNLGIQLTVFHNFKLGTRISKNDEFVPEFKYTLNKNIHNLGGECTLYFYKNMVGGYIGYEWIQVRKQEVFCVEGEDLGNGFHDCKEFLPLDYNDGIHIIQTGLRLRLPIPIDPGHMAFHFRPMYAYFWNDNNSAIPEGKDREGRSEFSKNLGHWNNNLLFFDKGSYLSIKLEVHVGISW